MTGAPRTPHYPRPAAIEEYGRGGFRFAGMSHRGSLLCLPSGIWAWDVARPEDIDAAALDPILAEAASIGLLLIGTGRDRWAMPPDLHGLLLDRGLNVEIARTGTAVSTYNILLEEGRSVAAALVAVG